MPDENNNVKKLEPLTIAQIAAGEVIESPSGVIKELIENSLDANSSSIQIFVEGSGYEKIQIRDNGDGITQNDLPLILESFTTSKLRNIDDLNKIQTLGFRGEALGAIRSVSQITVESRHKTEKNGWKISGKGNLIDKPEASEIPNGTQITVENLFYNVPVRREFASDEKKIKKEIIDNFSFTAIACPNVSFELSINGHWILRLPSEEYRSERIRQIYGDHFIDNLLPVYHEKKSRELSNSVLKTEGFISGFDFYRSNPSAIKLFVNNRVIHYKKLVGLFRNVYGELLPKNKFPVGFLFLKIDADIVDVNIHPQKKEVYFRDEAVIHSFLKESLKSVIDSPYPIRGRMMKRTEPNKEPDMIQPSIDFNTEDFSREQRESFIAPIGIDEETESPSSKINRPDEDQTPSTRSEFLLPDAVHTRLLNTFILGTSEEGIFLIDQHTAHERINYEKFKKRLRNNADLRQNLLHPVKISLNPGEKHSLAEHQTILQKIGFEWEDMGPAGMMLTSTPHYISSGQEEAAFFHSLHKAEAGSVSSEELFDSLAKDLSCKSSITAGYDNSIENIQLLLDELKKCEEPHRCPHGRPTVLFLGKDDIFHLFKRIDHRFR